MEFPKEPWSHWSSQVFKPQQRFEAWYAALNASHLTWALNKPGSAEFSGEMAMRHLGGIRIVRCLCDPCSGVRTHREIARDTLAYFGLLLVQGGSELIRHGKQEAYLHPGDALLWDSTRPLEFELPSTLKKITLLVPQDQLRLHLPQVADLIGVPIPAQQGVGAILSSHLAALGSQLLHLEDRPGALVAEVTLDLLATCLGRTQALPSTKARQELLDRITTYIEQHLADPNLGPHQIADGCGISVRYLHLLFAATGDSVSKWILTRRLEKCRRDLIRAGGTGQSITGVAFRWGFNDVSHFNRVFKKAFGLSPGQYQKQYWRQ